MAHCIQAIVAADEVAENVRAVYPRLPAVNAPQGFVILPVDADFIDAVAGGRPRQSTETFMLLTDGLHDLLDLSRFGPLAYIETEYFGGTGGQGAVVYSGREVVMGPEWHDSGPISRALGLIGVKRCPVGDRFSALGLGAYRSNDDLIDAAAQAQAPGIQTGGEP